MDVQPPMCSGTLKVQAFHVFWMKTPVQLAYHRQDYRHALPVLLFRRPSVLGGEFRIPLDPCIHPVRLLSTTPRMASKLEFALEYGWQTKQVHLRAPDVKTYQQWISLVRAALESGRRPLAACTAERPQQDLECSSVASTVNSSNSGISRFHATTEHQMPDEDGEEPHLDHDSWQHPSEVFVLPHHTSAETRLSKGDLLLVSSRNEAIGSCNCDQRQRDVQDRYFWFCLQHYLQY